MSAVTTFINQKVVSLSPQEHTSAKTTTQQKQKQIGSMWVGWCFTALVLCCITPPTILGQSIIDIGGGMEPDTTGTIECHRKMYTYRVTQSDENGKQCWDTLSVMACWGRCDSKEISDWRFPYKKSNHPVCVHYGRNRSLVTLRHCEEGALPSAARYEYLEAADCKCQQCSSSDTSCEGLRYRPQRSHPDSLGFRIN